MTRRDDYKRDGFLLLRNLFAAAEVERIRREAKEIFSLQMLRHGLLRSPVEASEQEFAEAMFRLFEIDLPAFTNCGKHAQHLISLHRLSLDERILEVVRELGLEFPNISTRPVMYFNSRRLAKKEVYWRLSMHQDWRSMQGSLDSVVVWLPLVRIDRSLGALEVIPGSHKWGLLEAQIVDGYGNLKEPVDTSQAVPVEVEPGDALFFSSFLVHQSGINSTEGLRWSCHFRYNNLREPTFIERGFPHPYIYKPQEELITENFPDKQLVERIYR